ncbi:uncharacterized protein LOC113768200 isoform X2 [Coffea eugenioides]|uniref:uncharacterized protein LOC113768200 isoform X2 n=1 Tax=Coffea eugenioides TaxID=49369 RepID=UPI000F609905|nr:uncharacterized protein LOC113768200 isoform X2 [Coffea eugenioides]
MASSRCCCCFGFTTTDIPITTTTTTTRSYRPQFVQHMIQLQQLPPHPSNPCRHFLHHSPASSSSARLLNATSLPCTSSSSSSSSPWDDKPYELLPNGRISYLDEQDIVSFLDPPKHLIPLDPSSFNPASYLWKKIEDIPEERRRRLLSLLNPRLISRAWEIAGTRYDDPKLAVKSASNLLSHADDHALPLEFWNCRTSGGPLAIAWMKYFKKALFYSKERTYGRFIGGSLLEGISSSFIPLYFTIIREIHEVVSTEQPCDLAYEFGDGLLDLSDYPRGFPKPAKHPWPFCDQVVVYVRHLGPGVLVGQAWQEGEALEQVPTKLCGEILMVKDNSGGM